MNRIKKSLKFKLLLFSILLIIAIYTLMGFIFKSEPDYKVFKIKRDNFQKTITETGVIQAVNYTEIIVPRIRRNQFQIIELVEEGKRVKKGDLLVKFDQTEIYKEIENLEEELETQKAELDKIKVIHKNTISNLNKALEQAKYSYDLAKVRKELMKYESRIRQEEAEIEMKQAEINYKEAKEKIEAQKIIQQAQIEKQNIKIKQVKNEIEKAKEDLNRLEISSPRQGLVVYQAEGWGPHRSNKVRVGDQVRPGQYILQLPDLSQMKVEFGINEVDRDRVWVGQKGTIFLEAFPELKLTGTVSAINKVTSWWGDEDSNVKLFNVEMEINETDDKIKPGLSAQVQLILDEKENQLLVPLNALYEENGKTYVLLYSSKPKPREVMVADRNNLYAVIEKGLKEGDKVVLNALTFRGDKIGKARHDYKIEKISEFLNQHFDNIEKLGINYDYDANRGKVDTVKKETDDFEIPEQIRKMMESRGIKITPEIIEKFKQMREQGTRGRMHFKIAPEKKSEGEKPEKSVDRRDETKIEIERKEPVNEKSKIKLSKKNKIK